MRDTFALFEKYPHDILNFSNSNGYRTMKDDTPADHEQVKTHVAAGFPPARPSRRAA
jgi:hypothetical protein